MPRRCYSSITVAVGSRKVSLPAKAFADLFAPNLVHTKVLYDARKDIVYLYPMNGDGAGGDLVTWIVEKGAYKDRFICHGF